MKMTFALNLLLFPIIIFSEVKIEEKSSVLATDFSRIKEVLKNDQLEIEIKMKQEKEEEIRKLKDKKLAEGFNFPKENEIWSFLSEYWIIKNIDKLKWNFEKPDFGIDEYFSKFLEEIGYYEVSFKILLLDNPLVPHFCLPSNPNEVIFLISVPFIRTMDLSKLEISLLLLEGFMRNKINQFIKKVKPADFENVLVGNFQNQKFPQKIFDDIFKAYDDVVFEKGFNFEEQFELTMKMEQVLKSNNKYWNAYLGLIQKIGNLTKTNILYKDYAKLYPSPEMQLNWLKPKKKVL